MKLASIGLVHFFCTPQPGCWTDLFPAHPLRLLSIQKEMASLGMTGAGVCIQYLFIPFLTLFMALYKPKFLSDIIFLLSRKLFLISL